MFHARLDCVVTATFPGDVLKWLPKRGTGVLTRRSRAMRWRRPRAWLVLRDEHGGAVTTDRGCVPGGSHRAPRPRSGGSKACQAGSLAAVYEGVHEKARCPCTNRIHPLTPRRSPLRWQTRFTRGARNTPWAGQSPWGTGESPQGTVGVDATLFLAPERPSDCIWLLQEIGCEVSAGAAAESLRGTVSAG